MVHLHERSTGKSARAGVEAPETERISVPDPQPLPIPLPHPEPEPQPAARGSR